MADTTVSVTVTIAPVRVSAVVSATQVTHRLGVASNVDQVARDAAADAQGAADAAQADATTALAEITAEADARAAADDTLADGIAAAAAQAGAAQTTATNAATAAANAQNAAQAARNAADTAQGAADAAQADATSALGQLAALDATYATDAALDAETTARTNADTTLTTAVGTAQSRADAAYALADAAPTVSEGDARWQALDSDLTSIAGLGGSGPGWLHLAAGVWTVTTPTASDVGLSLVENTALSTWAGTASITTLGTIVTGVWSGTAIAVAKGGTGSTTASDARTALGLAIGSDVQGYDAELAALAGLTSAANKLPYFTGSGAASVTDLTSVARTLLAASTIAGQRSALTLVPGTDVQAWDADLDAYAALSGTGIVVRTGSGTVSVRTLTAPAAGITVSNGDGASGNPTLALANDLSALEALGSTGLAARTGSDTWAQRTVTAGDGISVSNGDGSGGNPTISATGVTNASNGWVDLFEAGDQSESAASAAIYGTLCTFTPVAATWYAFEYWILHSTAVNSTGFQHGIFQTSANASEGVTLTAPTAGATQIIDQASGFNGVVGSTTSIASSVKGMARGFGIFKSHATAPSAVTIKFKSEVNGSAVTVHAAWLTYRRLS